MRHERFDSSLLALSLEQRAHTTTGLSEEAKAHLLALAQFILDHDTGTSRREEALVVLGLSFVDDPTMDGRTYERTNMETAERNLAAAVQGMNEAWRPPGTGLHRMVALRKLRTATDQTIRALKESTEQTIVLRALDNGGSRRGIISPVALPIIRKRQPKPQAESQQVRES
jgi:hypothetical protein